MATDSTTGRFPKKYTNNNSNSPRSSHARLLATGNKVSAPKPVNLPSLRHEHNKGSPDSSASSPSTGDTSSHHNGSNMTTPTHRWGSPLQQPISDTSDNHSEGDSMKNTVTSPDSTGSPTALPSATSAWATFSSTRKSSNTVVETVETLEPESKDPVSPKTKNEHVKVTLSHHTKTVEIPMPFTQESELSTMSWDEMVSEEMEMAVSVSNNDAEAPLDNQLTDDNGEMQQHVSPSDRFTDDYDRGYPHNKRRPDDLYNANTTRGSYRQYHHNHDSFNDRPSYGKWNNERRGSGQQMNHGRRSSNGSNNSATSPQRRLSQDRPLPATLLRRPHETDSLYSAKDDRPVEIVAAQRKAMTTAAEQAKKRREADEAERQAAAERARQKALALAPPPKKEEPKAPITILTHPPKVSPGTIITSTTANTGSKQIDKKLEDMTQDEKSWVEHVKKIKEADGKKETDNDNTTPTTSVTDWSSFAKRLQQSKEPKQSQSHEETTKESAVHTDEKQQPVVDDKPKQQLEVDTTPKEEHQVVDTEPMKSSSSHQDISSTDSPLDLSTTNAPVEPSSPNHPRRFIKSSSKLRHVASPIFSDIIGRKVPPKPASLQFMIDPADSDDELMDYVEKIPEEPVPTPLPTEPVKTTQSAESLTDREPPLTQPESTREPLPVEPVTEPDRGAMDKEIPSISATLETKASLPITDQRKGLYPEGLPDPGSLFTSTPSVSQPIIPAGHNENYPLLMFPMRSPLSCQTGSSPLIVRLLPPGQQHPSDLSSFGIK